jgi:WD40 repeat protein
MSRDEEQYDDDNDDEPEYLDSNDLIEVATLDDTTDDVPMEDDDDDDDEIEVEETILAGDATITMTNQHDANDEMEDENDFIDDESSTELIAKITSHTGPVYCCSCVRMMDDILLVPSSVEQPSSLLPSLLIASGGGDDVAFLSRVAMNTNSVDQTEGKTESMCMITTTTAESNNVERNNDATAAVVETQQLIYQHSDSVCAIAFGTYGTSTPKGPQQQQQQQPMTLLAVGGYDGMIVLYDGTNGHCLMNVSDIEALKSNFAGPTDIEWLTFHKTGTVLLAGSSSDGTVWMYHIVAPTLSSPSSSSLPSNQSYYTLTCMQVFVGHASMVSAGGFTGDGRWAVSIGNSGTRDDATVRIWNPKTGLAKHTIHLHAGSTTGILLPSSKTYTDNDDGNDTIYAGLTCLAFGLADDDATTVPPITTISSATNPTSSKLLLVGSEDGWAYICHVGTGKVLNAFRHAAEPLPTYNHGMDVDVADPDLLLSVEAVGFCPSNPMWCATGGADGILKIWDVNNGQCRHLCRAASSINDQSNKKNSSPVEGITRLCWLTGTHTSMELSAPTSGIPQSPIVFVATTHGMVHIWDARNGVLLHSLQASGRSTINDLQVLSMNNNNRIVVVTASEDHAVRLFQLNLQDLLHQPIA